MAHVNHALILIRGAVDRDRHAKVWFTETKGIDQLLKVLHQSRVFQILAFGFMLSIAIFVVATTFKTSPGDYLYYSKSGGQLAQKLNIYESGARWGSYAAVVSNLLFGHVPYFISNALVTLSIPVGSALLSKHVGMKMVHSVGVGCLALISGAGRENIQNGQVTGIIVLLFGLILSFPTAKFFTYSSPLLILYCIEMKPHVAIPIIIFLYADLRKHLKYVPVLALIIHSIINLYVGRILEIDFMKRLILLSNQDSTSPWPDINNILPLIDEILNKPLFIKIFSACLYLSLLILLFLKKEKVNFLIFTALFSPYMHTYDLLGILVIAISSLTRGHLVHFLGTYFLAISLVPNLHHSIPLTIATVSISTIFLIHLGKDLFYSRDFTYALLFLISISISTYSREVHNELIFRSTTVVIVCIGLLGLTRRKSFV